MADVMIEAFVRGVNLYPTLVYELNEEKMVTKKVEHTVKFLVNFEDPHYRSLTVEDIQDWFARQIIDKPFKYIKGKALYFAPKKYKLLTKEKATELEIIKKNQPYSENSISVWTGEFERGRKEIDSIDRLALLRKGDVIEVVLDRFENVKCSKCGADLTEETSVCLGYNECVCSKHLKSFIERYDSLEMAIKQYKQIDGGFK